MILQAPKTLRLWLLIAISPLAACGSGHSPAATVTVDGSSTVFPLTEAVAEEFRAERPDIRVTVGTSGTGGGFDKLARGEIDINDASRPITESEIQALHAAGIEFVELPVAYGGIVVATHPGNDFLTSITLDELAHIWRAEDPAELWSDLRPQWPDRDITLFGPDKQSGTFDYFKDVVLGERGVRGDFTASADDNTLVQGVAGEPSSLGVFGYPYYAANRDKLQLVPVDSGSGPVLPTPETIANGSYTPLSRPLFVYVRADALESPAVADFLEFYLDHSAALAGKVGYVELPAEVQEYAERQLAERKTGSIFAGARDVPLLELLRN